MGVGARKKEAWKYWNGKKRWDLMILLFAAASRTGKRNELAAARIV